ncbi:MAG TPA: response regulator, partial [Gemmatimonadales bacterium]|nr:response regulator [Gemmatimonadales bacterium]
MSRRIPSTAPSVVLLSVVREPARQLAKTLDREGAVVVQVPTGALALERARDVQPDVIMLEAELPDMAGTHACWLLHRDPRIGRNVPILVFASDKPTPGERVTALRAGAWDLLPPMADPAELVLKLQAYVQAKRNIDASPADALIDPATGLHSRPGLARRARELGALMVRGHGALACVVFALDAEPADPRAGTLVAHATRASDVVGALGPTEVAVLAPATDQVG